MTPQEKGDYFDAIKEVLLTYYSIPGNQMNLGTLAILCGLGSTIGTTDAEKSEYVRAKYSNFERLFDWIDSTDTSTATRGTVSTVTWRTSIEYTAEGENSA